MTQQVNKPTTKGIRHVIDSTRYSLQGLRAALLHEEAFRLEMIAFVFLAPLGIWLGGDGLERAMLVGSLMLVLVVELMNSAVESVVDRIGVEQHTLSGRAKDLGSAAVMLALINVALVWGLIIF